ncbi:restriction endonuclease subunit S [Micromonospora robiginosa]|uniref:Restriction endonuclease subunit S n=1 Tax=Micromonospora robiginosa TaxID=2749844 RepID=A0A7L6BBK1_9ACTN|nr:restriction endonuclease subunit S [Micromonospora ferruginea]QLQ39353.2 restriction endonuclease subunit S [Micromonospora ferruginea]
MSLLGAVPAGWTVSPMSEVADIRSGPSGAVVGAEDRRADGHPLITPRALADGRVHVDGVARVRREVAARLTRYLVSLGDVLITRTGTVGRVAWVSEECEGWLFSTGLLRLRTRQMNSRYLAYYLALPEVQGWFEHNRQGTAVPVLNRTVLGKLPVSVPPMERQDMIVRHLDLLDEQVEVHRRISQVAARTRNTLARSLIRGAEPG